MSRRTAPATTATIDATDRRILTVLQDDGRLSNQDISTKAGLSPAACWRRIRALEERGVIRRYAAQLDRRALALELCVFVHVSLSRHEARNVERFEKAIAQRPEVLECHATTGDADFLLKVVARDIASYDRFLEQFLLSLPGIAQVRSSIALREVKSDTVLPL